MKVTNFLSVTVKTHPFYFYCQLRQLATAWGFLLVRGATLDTCHHPVVSCNIPHCWIKRWPIPVRSEAKTSSPHIYKKKKNQEMTLWMQRGVAITKKSSVFPLTSATQWIQYCNLSKFEWSQQHITPTLSKNLSQSVRSINKHPQF